MEVEFRISAFAHGFDETDFYEVLASRPIKRRSQRGLANIYELFGRNAGGAYVHIVYRRQKDQDVVFHMNTMNEKQRHYYRKHH